jgi:hypothetical protein
MESCHERSLRCAADGVSTFVTHVSSVTDALSSFYYRLARPRGKPQMRQDITFNVANARKKDVATLQHETGYRRLCDRVA